MKLHTTEIETLFPVYTEWIEDFDSTAQIKFPSEYIILFLAADFSKIKKKQLKKTAELFLEKGSLFVCLWGPECEKAREIFEDISEVTTNTDDFTCVDHEEEILEQALGFALFNASTPERLWSKTSIVLISIGTHLGQLTLPVIVNDLEYLNRQLPEN